MVPQEGMALGKHSLRWTLKWADSWNHLSPGTGHVSEEADVSEGILTVPSSWDNKYFLEEGSGWSIILPATHLPCLSNTFVTNSMY